MIGPEPDVFVQIEGAAQGKIQTFLMVHPDEISIDPFHGAAGGEPEHEMWFLAEGLGDQGRHQPGGTFGIGLYH